MNKTAANNITLATLLMATFMGVIDTSIINVAAPSIENSLGASFAQIQWIIAGYIIAYGVGLVTGGRLGDSQGRKRLFQIGVFFFVITSAYCAIALDPVSLIIARIFQGLAGSLMLPQVLSTIQVIFEGPARAKALGWYGATIGLASILGQLVGGLLISWNLFDLGWRWVFIVNIPIGLLALVLCAIYVPESKAEKSTPLDLGGSTLLAVAIASLLYPLIAAVHAGWSLFFSLLIILSLLTIAAFIFWEKDMEDRGREPLVRLQLFTVPSYRIGMLTVLTFYGANAGFYLILSYFFQSGLHLSALQSGLGYAPLGVGFMVGSLVAKQLVDRFGAKLLVGGAIIKMAGLVLLACTLFSLSTLVYSPALFICGVGEGVVAVTLIGRILAGIHSDLAGLASGSLLTATQLGNVTSVALTGAVFSYLSLPQNFSIPTAFLGSLAWLLVLVGVTGVLLWRLEKSREYK